MSQSTKNIKVVPLRASEFFSEILAIQQEEEYESDSDSLHNQSYNDSELPEHNKEFYKTDYKYDSTFPNKNCKTEHQFEDKSNNQTYPSKNILSSGNKKLKTTSGTPKLTPKECKKDMSSHKKFKTPKSNSKNTPRFCTKRSSTLKSSAKKITPFRKCLNLEDAFKSTSKTSLFSTSKSSHYQSHQSDRAENDHKNIISTKPLDEIFASSLQISEDPKNVSHGEKDRSGHSVDIRNPFGSSKLNNGPPKFHEPFATPKTSVSSNKLLKEYRDNNFVTPHKPEDVSGIYKYETPSTQPRQTHFKNQQTPLFSIKEKSNMPSSQMSEKKTSHSSVRKDKENYIIAQKDGQCPRSLFKENILNNRINSFREDNQVVNIKKNEFLDTNVNKGELPSNLHIVDKNKFNEFHSQDHRQRYALADKQPMEVMYRNEQRDNQKHSKETPFKDKERQIQLPRETVCKEEPKVNAMPERLRDVGVDYQRKPNHELFLNPKPHSVKQLPAPNNPTELDVLSNKLRENRDVEFSQRTCLEQKTMNPKQSKMLTIKGKQYTILGKIGSGGSCEVLKVMNPEDSSQFAVKCVNLGVDQSIAQGYVNEIKVLQKLQGSDRVITMYDYEYVEKQRTMYVLLEMGDVDLSNLMKDYRRRDSHLPLPILVGYWTEMLTAVHHIHQNGIIHSDLKPANFLLVHGRLKLIDFGIASSLNADATSVMKDSTAGTFNYISPEAINAGTHGKQQVKITYKSDVWSLGCILYSMLYGRTPFSHVTQLWAKVAVLTNPNQAIEYPPLQGVPPVLMHALKWCLTHDVKRRPSVQELIDLPYLGAVERPKIPLHIMSKIREALTNEEWKCVIDALEGK